MLGSGGTAQGSGVDTKGDGAPDLARRGGDWSSSEADNMVFDGLRRGGRGVRRSCARIVCQSRTISLGGDGGGEPGRSSRSSSESSGLSTARKVTEEARRGLKAGRACSSSFRELSGAETILRKGTKGLGRSKWSSWRSARSLGFPLGGDAGSGSCLESLSGASESAVTASCVGRELRRDAKAGRRWS